MAKNDQKRPDRKHTQQPNDAPREPEIQYETKHSRIDANTITSGDITPHRNGRDTDGPVPDVYPAIDTDLGRDNLENDLTAADKQDL